MPWFIASPILCLAQLKRLPNPSYSTPDCPASQGSLGDWQYTVPIGVGFNDRHYFYAG
jgi:hypothetical protein